MSIDELSLLGRLRREERENTPLQFDVEIRIDDLGRLPSRRRPWRKLAHGDVRPLGAAFPIGTVSSTSSRWTSTEIRWMTLPAFRFTGDGTVVFPSPRHKEIHDDPARCDVVPDMTLNALHHTLYSAAQDANKPPYTRGGDHVDLG
ncbi:MAG: hypothetical protein M5R42_06185 [Rhodocyclaceae bacterium]|nr:hypothetical protein [Rhodocyclaceae bacterium]